MLRHSINTKYVPVVLDALASEQQRRWQMIRLQEVQRQLQSLSGHSFSILTKPSFMQSDRYIVIPEDHLSLPIDVLAAIAAYHWGKKMMSRLEPQAPKPERIAPWIGLFLARFSYSLERVIAHLELSSDPSLPLNDSTLAIQAAYQAAFIKPRRTYRMTKRFNRYKGF